jgi:SPP1 family predicted phage head-tail adaptor
MALRVAAGALRNVVAVEELTKTRGSMGQVVEDWAQTRTFRARIVPVKGKELLENGKEVMKKPVRIYCRYPQVLPNGCRLKYNSRIFDVVSVVNIDELNRELEILTEERT